MLLNDILYKLDFTDSFNIAVIGDFCLDQYINIDSDLDQIYYYTDLDIYGISDIVYSPGGAGNVAKNLKNLNINTFCIGLFGDDGSGYQLKKILKENGINTEGLLTSDEKITNTVLKPVRKSPDGIRKLNEMVTCNQIKTSENLNKAVQQKLNEIVPQMDAVVIVEQFDNEECGILTPETKDFLNKLALTHESIYFLADSKKYINKYFNMFLKCNQYEFTNTMLGNSKFNLNNISKNDIVELSRQVSNAKGIFITAGAEGVLVNHFNEIREINAVPVNSPTDTCGAGDSSTAGIISAMCMGYDIYEAALLGNIIASVTVTQLNTTGIAYVKDIKKILSDTDISSLINKSISHK
jgi:bifunctional ADP-heptose synthase (sugar kinase/adenylyltransferase)